MMSLDKNCKNKVKQHFSLFMVKKTINKKKKKDSSILTIINIYNGDPSKIGVPKFLDPLKFFHLYGDILISLSSPKVISLYSEYKQIQRIDFDSQNQTLCVSMQNIIFQHDSWQVLVDRLTSLSDSNAYDLANEVKTTFSSIIPDHKKSFLFENRNFSPKNLVEFQKYKDEIAKKVKEFEESNTIYIILRYRVFDILFGPELVDITYSKNCMEFFSGSIEDFISLIIENKLVDVYCYQKTDYYEQKAKTIMAYRNMIDPNPVNVIFKTKEGLEFISEFNHIPYFYGDEENQEISSIVSTKIPNITLSYIEKLRLDEISKYKNKLNHIKDVRENKLEKILGLYYKSQKEEGFDNYDDSLPSLGKHSHCILKEKICGFRQKS